LKIDSFTKPLTSASTKESKPRTAAQAGANSAQQTPVAQDSVQLTSSSQLQALDSKMESVPVVDAAKVEAIKQAIAEGRFTIDAGVIADGLIATAKELVRNQKG
jgi:negative regulator of flagellin synthesis FlgM